MSKAKKDKTSEWGLTHATEALASLDGESRAKLLENIRKLDPEVAEVLDNRLFRFSDLELTNDKGLAELLASTDEKTLCLALRGAGPKLLNKLFSCFSSRKVDMIQESIRDLGPQPKSKVEEAQAKIIKEAKLRIQQGSLILAGPDEKMV